jgi:hypothetical protein
MSQLPGLRRDRKKSCDGNHNLVESEKAIAPTENAPESGGSKKNGAKSNSRVNPAGAQKTIEARGSSRRPDRTRSKDATGRPLLRHRRAPPNRHRKSRGRVTGWEEWLWERFYLRSHSQVRCLGLLPLRRRRPAASCAKLSDRARLVTVAPTLSPMPNGKPLSGASGTAEFASSAIAFRRIDYWLKPPPRNASARSCLRASRTTREVRWRCFGAKWTSAPARGRSARILRARAKCSNIERDEKNLAPKILRPRSRRRPSRYVDRIVYWALADVTREAPCLGPSTTTSAPVFTRL